MNGIIMPICIIIWNTQSFLDTIFLLTVAKERVITKSPSHVLFGEVPKARITQTNTSLQPRGFLRSG